MTNNFKKVFILALEANNQ